MLILWVDQMAFEEVVVDKTTLYGTDEGKLELSFFDAHTCHFAKILNLCMHVGLGSLPYCESQLKKFQGANACNREPLLKAKAQCSDLLVLTSSDQLLFILQLLLLFQNNLP
jgi:hypothetical protein